MENNCMVSILCTAYNHQEYIAQTLESFLSQNTNFPFEILVSDDASTDKTAEIIRDYAARYPDIIRVWFMEENFFSKGGNFYTEYFFPNARGRYICICEGDDYWTDDSKLQRQVDFLNAHPDYSACVHNTMLHYCDGSQEDRPLLDRSGDGDVSMELIIQGTSKSFHTSSLMARREIITDTQDFYHVAYSHGFTDQANDLWLRLNGKIRYIDRIMSVYRIGSGRAAWSSGVDYQYDKLKNFVTGKRDMFRAFLPHVPEEYRELAQQGLLQQEFELMYIEGRDREQRREPYRSILRRQSFSYRLKNFVKSYFPAVQRLYRRRQGYGD